MDSLQVQVPSGGTGGTSTVQDEGVTQSTTVTTFNFVGAGVTASGSGATATITIPGGAGAGWTEVEVDFGSMPVYDSTFTITDAAITSSAVKVIINPCGKAATGRTADDWQWDTCNVVANPGTGSATCYVVFFPGPIAGRRKFQYTIG